MEMQCQKCSATFEHSQLDLDFYQRVAPRFDGRSFAIPIPSSCPDCRTQQRFQFRNFFNLYRCKSDLSGDSILSMYDSSAPFPVYTAKEWWSDQWDGLDFGIEPNFEGSLMQQIGRLHRSVPRMAIMNTLCENTDYCNLSFQSKDCYLVFGNVANEGCCYGHIVWQSKSCFDCVYTYRSELCYQGVDCVGCYDVAFGLSADNCTNCRFIVDCAACKHCYGCVGLRNKQYHIFNQECSPAEFEAKLDELRKGGRLVAEQAWAETLKLAGSQDVKYLHGFQLENVSGDYLYNCKDTYCTFDAKNCEDIRYCATVESFVDSQDCNYSPARTELSYNCVAVDGYHLLNCHNVLNQSSSMIYCDNCYSCRDCIACVGLRSKQYCILNRQYSSKDYQKLAARFLSHMESMGEWGAFFPGEFSPFAYNETMAQEYFPLDRVSVEANAGLWKELPGVVSEQGQSVVPDLIDQTDDSVTRSPVTCRRCSKAYRITPAELRFHRQAGLALGVECPSCRHADRMAQRNPRRLWPRECAQCSSALWSSYSPERGERILCEDCDIQGR